MVPTEQCYKDSKLRISHAEILASKVGGFIDVERITATDLDHKSETTIRDVWYDAEARELSAKWTRNTVLTC